MARRVQSSDRLRVPQPVMKRRLPSGRGAMEQPNVTHDGEAALSARFWVAVAVTGVATGLFGDLMMVILFWFQHTAFNYHTGSFESAVENVSGLRRVVVLLIAGAVGGVAWYVLRRYTKGECSEVDEAVWNGSGKLSLRRSLGTSVISEVVIGMGASLGREAAPKLMGGASASVLAAWVHLSPAQRRLLVACGAGAGLGAVYNVPLAAPCSLPRSSSGASPCPRSSRPWPARGSRPPPRGSTSPRAPPTSTSPPFTPTRA